MLDSTNMFFACRCPRFCLKVVEMRWSGLRGLQSKIKESGCCNCPHAGALHSACLKLWPLKWETRLKTQLLRMGLHMDPEFIM